MIGALLPANAFPALNVKATGIRSMKAWTSASQPRGVFGEPTDAVLDSFGDRLKALSGSRKHLGHIAECHDTPRRELDR